MASIAAGYNKKGELFYIIRVSRGRGMKLATDRFYPTANGHRIRQESRKTDAMAFYYSKEFEDRVKKEALNPIETGDTGIALPSEETLQQIGDKFMIEMDSLGYAGKTQANYKAILKKFVYPALGGYSPSHLTEPVCEDFLKGISSKYGENASKRARMVLCTTFDYEINAGQIEEKLKVRERVLI
jgi:hypothetical protein